MVRMAKSYQPIEIVSIVNHSDRVKELQIQPQQPLEHQAAQFLMVRVEVDEKNKSSEYTLVNAPGSEELRIAVDNHPKSKVGRQLHQMDVGDTFEFRGPYGRFQVDLEHDPSVFICKNIGIVCTLGNLEWMAQQDYQGKITVFNLVSKKFEPIYQQRLKELQDQLDIDYQQLGKEDLGKKAFKKGKVPKKELEEWLGQYQNAKFYLSGESSFFKELGKRLRRFDIEKDRIKKELF